MRDSLNRDARYALRQMARAPLLTGVAALVLALGIGMNTAIFAVLDGVLFRPPPGIHAADRLIDVRSVPAVTPASRVFNDNLTYGEFLALRDDPLLSGDVMAWTGSWGSGRGVAMRTSQGDESVSAEFVTSAYFSVLRSPMSLGTAFQQGDDRFGDPVMRVVLGNGFWKQRMGGAEDVIGGQLTLNGYPFTIVGVAGERFHGAGGDEDPQDVWLHANASALLFPDQPGVLESGRRFRVVARLTPGVTRERAGAAAEAAGLRVPPAPGDEAEAPRRLSVAPFVGPGSDDAMEALVFVGGIGGLIGGIILLIACVNVGALLLGRSLARRREIAIRLSLGAGRGTIIRQLLTESVMLGLLAGALGILVATWALDAVGARLFTFPIQLSPRFATLTASVGLAAGTGILFGLVPALHATRTAVFSALKDGVAGNDPRTSRLRGWFATAQLALSLPLLAAAGLLLSGMVLSMRSDSVVRDPETLFAIWFDLRPAGYDAAQLDALLTEGRTRVEALPGVSGAAFARTDPLSGGFTGWLRLPAEAAAISDQPTELVLLNSVDPEFFETVGLQLLRGRPIDRTDVTGGPAAVVIDEDLARRLWPGEDPLGRTLTYLRGRDRETPLTVVGVTRGGGSEWDGSDPTPVLYGARRQFPDTLGATLLIRASGEAGTVLAGVRRSLNALDARLVVARTMRMTDRMRANRTELAHAAAGAAGIGLLALLLACIGLYAVVAFGVAERTREIGVRLALGAAPGAVVRLFIRGGLRLALFSIAIGIPLTFAVVKLLGAGVFGVARFTTVHAGAMAGITVLLVCVAALSSWIPARRSATVDPVNALRAE
jgi:predicted permease